MTDRRTALVVLGMHRSGTSSVAGTLALLGARAPQTLMRPASDNPKGFWESEVLATFNDRLLHAGSSTWHDWRRFDLTRIRASLPDFRAEAADKLTAEFGDAQLIVLKDPRICRLFDFWRGVLEDSNYRVVVVSPLRSPAEVAASLMARNAMSRGHALRLWLRHVSDGERASRNQPRRFLAWSDFIADWRVQVDKMGRELGIVFDRTTETEMRVDDFLSAEMKRQNANDSVPDQVRRAYQLLLLAARDGDHPDLQREMDAIHRAFDQACALFADTPR
ncbi:hypothetical protein [uncultured Brevundimonas sp.]|uniref:hypothetical protein n=1 Tax=uncultured Brevundimonas sp. TaxID=213418 RepID=UPI0025FAD14B|nr:hypothetical protein [uncultured Brevundimonas sp.]